MKKATRAWAEEFRTKLPTEAPQHVRTTAAMHSDYDNYIIYRRQSIEKDFFYEIYDCIPTQTNARCWAAECRCTACGELFYTNYAGGALLFSSGEDGNTYIELPEAEDEYTIEVYENETVGCPYCGETGIAVRASTLGSGRTYRQQFVSCERIGDVTAILYWMETTRLDAGGYHRISLEPREAVAISTERELVRFTKHFYNTRTCEGTLDDWRTVQSFREPENIPFYTYGYGPSRSTIGAWNCEKKPEMSGSTGEKSAVDEYIAAGGISPALYLKEWRKHPNIENLVRAGRTALISECLANEAYHISTEMNFIDFDEVKPHRMLHMTKEEFRETDKWNRDMIRLWMHLKSELGEITVEQMQNWCRAFGPANVHYALDFADDGMDRLAKYFRKTDCQFYTYRDYREMLQSQHERMNLGPVTEAERYPRDLQEAHDALVRIRKDEKNAALNEQFADVKKRYAALEWSDGTYCIVIPETNADLVLEGQKLHHCVGRYGKDHISGKSIFFVRKARRPERSYFTLNEDLTGEQPRRIQLHGYGNEWIAGKRLQIPKEVLAFCERWEREVLAPWYAQQKKNERKTRKKAA